MAQTSRTAMSILLLCGMVDSGLAADSRFMKLPGGSVMQAETFSSLSKWHLLHMWTEKTVNVSCPGSPARFPKLSSVVYLWCQQTFSYVRVVVVLSVDGGGLC